MARLASSSDERLEARTKTGRRGPGRILRLLLAAATPLRWGHITEDILDVGPTTDEGRAPAGLAVDAPAHQTPSLPGATVARHAMMKGILTLDIWRPPGE